MDIVIEKGVPLPSLGRGTVNNFPLKQMEIGDSFAVDTKKRNTVMNQIRSFEKTNPAIKFTTRKVEDTVRVWRVK